MTRDRAGGVALIVSAAGFIITMALHPVGGQSLTPDQLVRVMQLSTPVHALALACLPIAFFGALILSRRLDTPGAIITYGFGAVAVMNAAICSGFIAPQIANVMGQSDTWRILFTYTRFLNQSFALIYVMASSAAIVLWSLALRRQAKGLGISGLVLGPLIVITVLTRVIGLDAHGFGAIVLVQGAWSIACGVWLLKG